MIVTIAGYKGGVGKTTTAVHLAACLQERGRTLLVDGDPNHSATIWSKRGSLPFDVLDVFEAQKNKSVIKEYEHVVVDTKARPNTEDLQVLVSGCNLLILPSTPDLLALDALKLTLKSLREIGAERFKTLLTAVPPKPSKAGEDARKLLNDAGMPVFDRLIRRFAAYQKAVVKGMPVNCVKDDDNANVAWADYQAVTKELLS